MIPKRIVLEDFLSFGSPATEIVFTDDEPLWVLGGPNGVGKSAVFDAMTYALYAEHRGGASDHACLVRHGANSFRVVFEFEFNGNDYRITRSRPLTGRPTQRIERLVDGRWHPVDLPPAAGRQDSVKVWTERTLGLGFDAFTASVLLRQGSAHEILTATGSKRLAILKKIIGVERYETLSNRVHQAARRSRENLDDLRSKRDGLSPVTNAEVQVARDALAQAEVARTSAHEQVTASAERLTVAKRWVALDGKWKDLERQLCEATERAEVEQRIHNDKDRLDELTTVVPVLRNLVTLEARLATAKCTLRQRKIEAEHLRAALIANQLREEIERHAEFINAADQVAAFPSDLVTQLTAAQEKAHSAAEAHGAAQVAKAEVGVLLKQATEQQRRFATVGVGVACSRCGQPVSAEHARRERDLLDAVVWELAERAGTAEANEQEQSNARLVIETELRRLDELNRNQATASRLLAEKKRAFTKLRVTTDPCELRRQLTDKEAECQRHEIAAAEQLGVDRTTLDTRLEEVGRKVTADEQTIATDQGKISTFIEQLFGDWRARLGAIDIEAIQSLDAERQKLESANVRDQFKLLLEDAVRRQELEKQRIEVANEINAIPPDARVPVADAEQQAIAAKAGAQAADRARDEAKVMADDLARRADDYRHLVTQIADAEKQDRIHHRLDELLGKEGLQRELVRSAEREIVRLANDTVHNLSDGDLSVELDDIADSGDEAFALRFRRLNDPMPTGVDYLSGSQKFRVAISVALAIGRFATGQARPLESVIIDEGFGSLDRDGLRAAAEELNRLRQYLRRIVLVSHHEEFANSFPVVIRLSPGEYGTTATAMRH